MSFLWLILLLLSPLTVPANECLNGFEACEKTKLVSGAWKKTAGIKCEGQCRKRVRWCKMRSTQIDEPDLHCPTSSDNVKFENCLSVKFTITVGDETIDYLWSAVETHWEIAEKFCSGKGYNLLSFSSKQEHDDLKTKMKEALADPKTWVASQPDFKDPIGQRCEAEEINDKVVFWTGLFYDNSRADWNYTDGSKVNYTIGVDTFGNLENALTTVTNKDHRRLTWNPNSDNEFQDVEVKNELAYLAETNENKIQIICKKSSKRTPKSWKPNMSQKCITGHECGNGKCIAGAALTFSSMGSLMKNYVLGKDAWCDNKSDQKITNFKHAKVKSENEKRNFVYLPILREDDTVFKLCEAAGMKPVAIQTVGDKDALLTLPKEYQKQNPDDFLTVSRNLSLDALVIPLKLEKGGKWPDGSKPEDDLKIQSYDTEKKLYLQKDGEISDSPYTGKVNVVCQENSARGTSGNGNSGSLTRIACELWLVLVVLASSLTF